MNEKNKYIELSHKNNRFLKQSFLIMVVGTFMLAAFLTFVLIKDWQVQYEIGDLIGFALLILFFLVAIFFTGMYLFRWRIIVGENYFSYRGMLSKEKVYDFANTYLEKRPLYTNIYSTNQKLIVKISDFLISNMDVLISKMELYYQLNNLKAKNSSEVKIIKYGDVVRRGSIFFIIFGLILITIAFTGYNVDDELHVIDFLISFVILGLITLIPGILGILLCYVWKIHIYDNKVEFTNIFGVKKTIPISNLEIKYSKSMNVMFIYLNRKKYKRVLVHATINSDALLVVKRRRE